MDFYGIGMIFVSLIFVFYWPIWRVFGGYEHFGWTKSFSHKTKWILIQCRIVKHKAKFITLNNVKVDRRQVEYK